ncbi:hypothetical protein Tco_0104018 [Tanacetum coccineum]
MASNIKNFKCLIHFNETRRGSILSEDLTYSMLQEMVMQKFKLEANVMINLSFKLLSFDFAVDIIDDDEAMKGKHYEPVTRDHIDDNEVFEMLFIAIGASVPQLSTPRAYDRCCPFKGSIQGNKSGSCGHGWKQSDCADCIWYMQRGNKSMLVIVDIRTQRMHW